MRSGETGRAGGELPPAGPATNGATSDAAGERQLLAEPVTNPLESHAVSADSPNKRSVATPVMSQTERLVGSGLTAAIALFLLFTPWPLMEKMRTVGHACCAQIPSHTIRFAGQAMPLDARNSGIYSAVFVTIAMGWLTGRRKGALFANSRVGLVLMLFVLAMMFDGFNSLAETHNLRTFYADTNTLRIITGTLAGTALTILTLPLFSLLVWRDPEPVAIADDFGELAGYLVAALVVILALTKAPASLYYPMSILSIAGLLTTLTFVNTCIGIVSLRRRNTLGTLSSCVVPALAGLLVTCFEIMAIDIWLAHH